ncbi:MAG: hypothetical protein QOF35_592 [Actinomycetota bacterium]|nr:hypothetical protein [Actinomycetota bacterium]
MLIGTHPYRVSLPPPRLTKASAVSTRTIPPRFIDCAHAGTNFGGRPTQSRPTIAAW